MTSSAHMDGHDKVLDHTRMQLSALFDGELALDEARFLERRLQHDRELAGCVSRWQLAGDILRGQATAAAPAGFAGRVAAALVAGATAAGSQADFRQAHAYRSRRIWGSGAALAASVAVVALFMARQSPEAVAPDSAPQVEMASAAPARQAPATAPAPAVPRAPDSAAQLAAATVAVAEVPRRAASRRAGASRGQAQRAATTRIARTIEQPAQPQLAAVAASASSPSASSPFAPDAAAISPRPWPRALLPNAATAFNVGYGGLQPDAGFEPPTHPFRLRTGTVQEPQEESAPSPR